MSVDSPQLLLVDDDASMIRFLSQVLDDFPDQRFAQSGEAALLLARQSTPDLILLDANMPGMTGFDVCELLKADPALAHVPVIFVTSYDAPAMKADALKLGASDFVAKPIAAADLKARVSAVLEASRLLKNLASPERTSKRDQQPDSAVDALLVIDSTSGTLAGYASGLSTLGRVQLAISGKIAWIMALNEPPSVFIIDADLFDIDALGLCAKIRATSVFQNTPIIFIAKNSDTQTEQRAQLFGATAVLSKPIDAQGLQNCVMSLLAVPGRRSKL